MSRNPFFERVHRARDATCFQCYGALDDLCASGFEAGNGALQGYCDACRAVTFFDVIPDNDNEDAQADALASAVMREVSTY